MSEETEKNLEDLSPEEHEKLKKIVEKDSKSFRQPSGFWHWAMRRSPRSICAIPPM